MMFADDILLFKPISVPYDAALFQADVNLVNYWVCNNHLTTNTNKTEFMLISRRRNLPKNFLKIFVGSDIISDADDITFLLCDFLLY